MLPVFMILRSKIYFMRAIARNTVFSERCAKTPRCVCCTGVFVCFQGKSALTLPEERRAGRQLASAAEVVHFSGDEVYCAAAAGIEMRGIGLVVNVDRDEHALAVCTPFPDALPVGEDELLEVAVAQSAAFAVRLRHGGDGVGQLVPLGRVERGPQRVVALLLGALGAPLTAVIDARNARHAEQQRVDKRQMAAVLEDGRDAGDIVVVDEREYHLAGMSSNKLHRQM